MALHELMSIEYFPSLRLPGRLRFRDQPQAAGKQIRWDGRRGHLECDITALRTSFAPILIAFLLPGIAANERVAGFIPIGHVDDQRGDRACPLLADVVTRF
jgi:hypothetical protein